MRFVLNGSCKNFTVKAFVGICTQNQLHLNALFCSHHVSVTVFNQSCGNISWYYKILIAAMTCIYIIERL